MEESKTTQSIRHLSDIINEYSDKLDFKNNKVIVIMAAGQGKRIKSNIPKVAHKIWGIPAISRLAKISTTSLKTKNQIIVVGNRAEEVIKILGHAKNRIFIHQKEQHGTGHALQVATQALPPNYQGKIITFPGDPGLINTKIINEFNRSFEKSKKEMFLLTGIYKGDPKENYYGRVLRVTQGREKGKILAIIQHKDILYLKKNQKYIYQNHSFSKDELLNIREFDSGIFTFNFPSLNKYLKKIKTDNIQKEYYLTDLVKIYVRENITFDSYLTLDTDKLIGFNNKVVLKKVEKTFQKENYNKLKNIISIENENNFFIDEKVVEDIIKKDKKNGPLDINLSSGVYIDKNVVLNKNNNLGKNVKLLGNITLEENVSIGNNVTISTFSNQKITLKKNCFLQGNNVIKGKVTIGENSKLGEGVNVTGNNEYPSQLGKMVSIIGSCYIFGCLIEDETEIESSILVKKKIKCIKLQDGKSQPIKFIIPAPVGIEAIREIE